MAQPVVAVVVAAGLGVRYGGNTPKPALQVTGKSLLVMSVEAMAAGGCTNVVLVLNPKVARHLGKGLAKLPIPVVRPSVGPPGRVGAQRSEDRARRAPPCEHPGCADPRRGPTDGPGQRGRRGHQTVGTARKPSRPQCRSATRCSTHRRRRQSRVDRRTCERSRPRRASAGRHPPGPRPDGGVRRRVHRRRLVRRAGRPPSAPGAGLAAIDEDHRAQRPAGGQGTWKARGTLGHHTAQRRLRTGWLL